MYIAVNWKAGAVNCIAEVLCLHVAVLGSDGAEILLVIGKGVVAAFVAESDA